MTKINRRNFIRHSAILLGATVFQQVISACTPKSLPETPTGSTHTSNDNKIPPPNPTTKPVEQSVSSTKTDATTIVQATNAIHTPSAINPPELSSPTVTSKPLFNEYPHLVVVRGNDPAGIVQRAVSALGGMEKFVKPGANVIIKPNICTSYHTYEYAATTNPWVIGALVQMCLETGAKTVKVMDYPFGGAPNEAYSTSGIEEQVKAAGGEMVIMSRMKYIETAIPEGKSLKKTKVYDDILNADVFINVPIAKNHGSTRLTLGMKNIMGAIWDRGALHNNLGQRIADINSIIRPALTIIDAVRILMANGPTGGDLNDVKKVDTVIASADIVSADSYATSLFGLTPQDIDYIPAGTAMGLGRSDLENVKIEELSL